jgi:GT2 family glycosyltransferase/glycogen synthase
MLKVNSDYEKSTLAIIIINYNSTDYTLQCIDSVKRYITFSRVQLIVVDNKSEDMPDRIIHQHPDIQLIKNTENIGFGKAINIVLNMIKSKFIILLNPDVLIIDNSFHRLINYLEKNPEISVIGPKILDGDGSVQGSARRFPTIWTSIFGRKSPLTKLFPGNPVTKREFMCFNGDKHKPQFVDWVSGACMVIRGDAIKQINGFDSRFFMYWEDADLCKRLKDIGWQISYFPKAQVYHHTGKSSETRPLASIYHFHNSCYFYFTKHSRWPIKIITPLVFLGLGLRSLFVMGLNILQRLLKREIALAAIMTKQQINEKQDQKKIYILRIVSRLNIGGPSIHCSILTKGLNRSQFKSKLVSGKISSYEGDMSYLLNDDYSYLLKVPELQREINFLFDIKALYKIIQIIFKEKPDIVHTHMAKAGAISRAAVFIHNLISRKKIKTVHTFHGNVLDGYFNPHKSRFFISIEKALAKVTDAIIAISKTQHWELTEHYDLAGDDKVHIINLGFDLTRFSSDNGKGKLRSSIGVGDDTLLIGIVGRLVPIKNHVLFMDTAKLIMERYPEKDIRCMIVGDGELREYLESYARGIGIRKNVFFYGWENEIQKIYSDIDILLLTSNNEGTPVSIIESMASGVPVVTTGVGGVKDLLGRIEKKFVDNNRFSICERGILCPKGDADAMAGGIQYLLENNNDNLVKRARDFVFKNYTDKRLIENIVNLYKNLV